MQTHRRVAIVVVADIDRLVESDGLADVRRQFCRCPGLRIGESHTCLGTDKTHAEQ